MPIAYGASASPLLPNALGVNGLQAYALSHYQFVKSLSSQAFSSPLLTSITPPVVDMGLAFIVVIMVISIAAFIYILASIINSSNAKNWAKIQIYEALLSMLLLMIFLGIFYLFLTNPSGSYSSVGLLPNECSTPSINTLFNLSACDIGTFSNNALGYFDLMSVVALASGGAPGIGVKFSPMTGFGISMKLDSVMPDGIEGMLGTGLSALIFFLVLNNLQLILVSGSILFLTFFITLGVFARLFGITRTFGGAMIAFGIGLGVIYPLLISITYGFIDVKMISASTAFSAAPFAIADMMTFIYGSSLPFLPTQIVLGLGYVVAGLTFIPFINFIILDAFIVDFSKAVGEKVSFMALLSNFI
ncbi:MAG: hypothetical protein M1465_01195 [Candidatus Marsarchaeota archaeon]|nr:hypothetical protein [Candidatus Marsarchaeota archaeon]